MIPHFVDHQEKTPGGILKNGIPFKVPSRKSLTSFSKSVDICFTKFKREIHAGKAALRIGSPRTKQTNGQRKARFRAFQWNLASSTPRTIETIQ